MSMSKEAEISIAASSMFPGFRFSPTDEELILHYMKKKVEGFDKCVEVIPEVDICKYEPWDLPARSIIKSDHEWFFFSPRGKKYPNGSQSRRATEIGYWKATGKERGVKSGSSLIGTKRTLVFHIGRAPKGERTEWIMHEYCMAGMGQDSLVICRLKSKTEFHAKDSSNQYGVSPNPASMIDSNATVSGSVIDVSGGEKATCSKKSGSSYDSHSVELIDDASASDHKLKDDMMQQESYNCPNLRGNAEDDWFADILNDNIVELDSLSAAANFTDAELQSAVASSSGLVLPAQSTCTPSQGTANRRIRLRKWRRPYIIKFSRLDSPRVVKGKHINHSDEKVARPVSDAWPRTLMMRLRGPPGRLYVAVIVMALVILLLMTLPSCSQQVSRFSQSTPP
ncbi:hypothetical protein Ancab_011295 [Ancistrocladus abbreviatus]